MISNATGIQMKVTEQYVSQHGCRFNSLQVKLENCFHFRTRPLRFLEVKRVFTEQEHMRFLHRVITKNCAVKGKHQPAEIFLIDY